MVVMVKHERAVEFDELHVLTVEFGGDCRLVVLANLGELLGDVDFDIFFDVHFGHGILPRQQRTL
jgi:hypothetical protein